MLNLQNSAWKDADRIRLRGGLSALFFAFVVATAHAQIYVATTCGDDAKAGTSSNCADADGPKATIQTGIDATVNGDEVIVADGTYTGVGNRDLNFGGRLITVRSQNGPTGCIIDCEKAGRGFIFVNGETDGAVVQGFTITNGTDAHSGPEGVGGGGIFAEDGSSPSVIDCTFLRNVSGTGGGEASTAAAW